MADKNALGGGNRYSLYAPMSDVEQEVIDRLVQANDLMLEIVGWGFINDLPGVTFGDLRISIPFQMAFSRPELPMPVHYFDLRLKTRTGLVLHQERMPTLYGGKPIEVAAGVVLNLVWDIAIQHMDPKVVKMIKPGAIGLTSENFDRDTGNVTLLGNRRLNERNKRLLKVVRTGEALARKGHQQEIVKATTMEKGDK